MSQLLLNFAVIWLEQLQLAHQLIKEDLDERVTESDEKEAAEVVHRLQDAQVEPDLQELHASQQEEAAVLSNVRDREEPVDQREHRVFFFRLLLVGLQHLGTLGENLGGKSQN